MGTDFLELLPERPPQHGHLLGGEQFLQALEQFPFFFSNVGCQFPGKVVQLSGIHGCFAGERKIIAQTRVFAKQFIDQSPQPGKAQGDGKQRALLGLEMVLNFAHEDALDFRLPGQHVEIPGPYGAVDADA